MVVPTSGKREQVLKMIEAKEKLEAKINQLGAVLKRVRIFGSFLPIFEDSRTIFEDFLAIFLLFVPIKRFRHSIFFLEQYWHDGATS